MKKLAFLLSLTILIASCGKEEEPIFDPGTEPVLPPASSMAPNFDAFAGNDAAGGGRQMTVRNWLYAATSVGVYTGILTGALVIPVTAYSLAMQQEPVFDRANKVWVWAYDVTSLPNKAYSIKLTAAVDGAEVNWTGYVSEVGGFADFVWFTGNSNISASSGSWTLLQGPDQPTPWLSAEWTRSDLEDAANVKFTVEKEGSSKGSSIDYSVDPSTPIDRQVTIIDLNSGNTIAVAWSSVNKQGRVLSQAFFNDSFYHCWDSSLNDVTCE